MLLGQDARQTNVSKTPGSTVIMSYACRLTANAITMMVTRSSTKKRRMPAVAPGGKEKGQQSVAHVSQLSPISSEQI